MYKKYRVCVESKMAAPAIEYRFLGNSGLKVSNICLGAMNFGKTDKLFAEYFNSSRQCDEETSHKLMDRYAELGGNFIDTANIYTLGKSEEIVGTWLRRQRRDKFVIATKVRFPFELDDVNSQGLSRRHLTESCEGSLKRLQTNYIDLYQAHQWDNATPIEETLRTMDDLVRCGKIRYYGFSNVCGWQLQKIVDTARHIGLNPCISLQQQYSLLERSSEYEAFMVCHNEGLGVLPWSPLKSGLLTGKFKREETPDADQSRVGLLNKIGNFNTSLPEWSKIKNDEQYWTLIEIMTPIAKAQDKSLAQVAIRWLLQKDIVSSVIIGVSTMAQLEDNMGAATGWKLTDEEMAKLEDITLPEKSYPYQQLFTSTSFGGQGRYNMYNRDSFDM